MFCSIITISDRFCALRFVYNKKKKKEIYWVREEGMVFDGFELFGKERLIKI